LTPASPAADKPGQALTFDHALFKLRLVPRTPKQIAAFYEGRGFPPWAIDELRDTCFITVLLRNKSDDIVWFDLHNWQFIGNNGPLQRQDRQYWLDYWQKKKLPANFRTTFRWTLIPEQLDFRPNEGEGGNIILPRTPQAFTVRASFATGADRKGPVVQVQFDNVHCAEDPAP
jgi:hypothetical protein